MTVARSSHAAWREIDGETYVIDLRSKTLFGFNAEAGSVWRHLAEMGDAAAIAAEIADESRGRMSARELTPVVEGFLAELVQRGLAESPEGAPERDASRSAEYPLFAPRVSWSEHLTAAGYSCAHKPGQSSACIQVPKA